MKNDMTIAQEKIFGPLLSVIAYDSEDGPLSARRHFDRRRSQ
jgi:acyl-CoA reductase-like NAD-dependent aldehyde dehydrogenase